MSIHWYAHHLGDYSKDTQDLSMAEHGAYRLLLDHLYSVGGRMADDRKALYRVCKASTPRERSIVDKILLKKFLHEGGLLTQKRVLEEIAKRCEISEKRKQAAAIAHANVYANGLKPQPTANSHIKLASEDDVCAEEVLPSAWHTYAEGRGISDEQIYASWRKFKDKTSHPYRLNNWRGWIDRERVRH